MSDIFEPIILEPPGLTPERGWQECQQFVDECGGLEHRDGEVNWRAAFGADPGISSCPACKAMHWAWGTRIECSQCGFKFETDWWPMYSYGVSAAKRVSVSSLKALKGLQRLHVQRLTHPYYRYGYEHPVEDAWKEHDKIDWRNAMRSAQTGQQ